MQALQLLYGGDDPWLRERNSLRAIFRLTERGYLPPALGRELGHALVYLRTVEHRLQILHEFQTHTLPEERGRLGLLARRMGIALPPAAAAPALRRRAPRASPRACTGPSASSSPRRPRPPRRRCASRATPRSRPPASRIRIARARTCAASWKAGPSFRTRRAFGAARSPASSRMLLDALWQSPIPTRPSTSSSASSRRRARAPPTSISLADRARAARQPPAPLRARRAADRAARERSPSCSTGSRARRPSRPPAASASSGPSWPRCSRPRLDAGGAPRPAAAAQAGAGAGHHLAHAARGDRRRAASRSR